MQQIIQVMHDNLFTSGVRRQKIERLRDCIACIIEQLQSQQHFPEVAAQRLKR